MLSTSIPNMECVPQTFWLEPGCLIPPEIWAFAASRNMEVTQENKHRVLRQKLCYEIDPLLGGREMFIEGLPRDCFEPELIPHLERFGLIYEFRLAMHSAWENRGFAYIRFCCANFNRLVQELNNCPIRPGYCLQVTRCVNNCNLLLIGVPFDKTENEIREELNRISPALESVKVVDNRNNQLALAKGFGQPVIATFLNHELTWMARDQLIFKRLRMWGERIHVEWAVQKTDDFPRNYCCPRILHVLGLSSDITNEHLFNIFNEQSNDGVTYMVRRQDQAFIFHKSQDQARIAKFRTHATLVNGNFLYVNVVNPTESSTRQEPLTMEAAIQVDLGALEEGDADLRDENRGLQVYQKAPEREEQAAQSGDEEEYKPA